MKIRQSIAPQQYSTTIFHFLVPTLGRARLNRIYSPSTPSRHIKKHGKTFKIQENGIKLIKPTAIKDIEYIMDIKDVY